MPNFYVRYWLPGFVPGIDTETHGVHCDTQEDADNKLNELLTQEHAMFKQDKEKNIRYEIIVTGGAGHVLKTLYKRTVERTERMK